MVATKSIWETGALGIARSFHTSQLAPRKISIHPHTTKRHYVLDFGSGWYLPWKRYEKGNSRRLFQ